MKAIVCVDKNWGIGKNNDLLFHFKEDMRHFKEYTLGNVVVMGSNTLISFPDSKPLPDRTNIVLWPGGSRKDVVLCQSLDEIFDTLKNYDDEKIYIVGGAMFYKTMLDYCSEVIVTKVDADGEAQVFFENLDKKEGWAVSDESEPMTEGKPASSSAAPDVHKTSEYEVRRKKPDKIFHEDRNNNGFSDIIIPTP